MLLQVCLCLLLLIRCHAYHQSSWSLDYNHHRIPQDVMVDVVNNLAFKLLAIHNEGNDNNIAISPYGAVSVLVALLEGVRGDAMYEIQHAANIPSDSSVVRIGLRDINRHLKSYFIPEEGFLSGLTLSTDNVTLNREYEDILKFYGYDINSFNNALYPDYIYTTGKPELVTESNTAITTEKEEAMTEMTSTTTNPTTESDRIVISESTLAATTSTVTNERITTEIISTTTADTATSTATTTRSAETGTATTTTEKMLTSTEEQTNSATETISTSEPERDKIKDVTTVNSGPSEATTNIETTASGRVTDINDLSTESTFSPSTNAITTSTEMTSTVTTLNTESSPSTEEMTDRGTGSSPSTDGITSSTEMGSTVTTLRAESSPSTHVIITSTEMTSIVTTLSTESSPSTEEMTDRGTGSSPSTDRIPTSTQMTSIVTTLSTESNPSTTDTIASTETTRNTDSTTMTVTEDGNNISTTTEQTEKPVRRSPRSLVDYVIARYYDDHTITQRPPPYVPEKDFYFLVNGKYKESNVNYMTYDTVLPFHYIAHLNTLALRFPLDSSKYYLLLLLPNGVGGTEKLICDLRLNTSLKYIIKNLRYTHVKAVIPSFMLKGYIILTSTFQKMGVRKVFEPRHADFSPMTGDPNIYVANIEQAITVNIRNYVDPVTMNSNRYLHQSDPVLFKADRPFLYFVIDSEIDVTLMAGKVVNPLNSRIR